jgi:hypothetical protein
VLFDRVCEHLNLLEKDYFGLLFQDHPEQKVSDYNSMSFMCIFCKQFNFTINLTFIYMIMKRFLANI